MLDGLLRWHFNHDDLFVIQNTPPDDQTRKKADYIVQLTRNTDFAQHFVLVEDKRPQLATRGRTWKNGEEQLLGYILQARDLIAVSVLDNIIARGDDRNATHLVEVLVGGTAACVPSLLWLPALLPSCPLLPPAPSPPSPSPSPCPALIALPCPTWLFTLPAPVPCPVRDPTAGAGV